MPSPFPGMDPYLEDPRLWPDVHSRMINVFSELVAEQVSPHFTVHIEERVYIASLDEIRRQLIVPDLYVIQQEAQRPLRAATATITPPAIVEPFHDPQVHDHFIEIRDARSQEVVTTLEVLSPANKAMRSNGREQFMRKRETILASPTHWIEVDLLRAGERPSEVTGRDDYYSLLARGDRVGQYEVWDSQLRDRLPTIAIPLRPPFADVALDLQAAFVLTYSRGYYADKLDYAQMPPPPALPPANAAWVANQVRSWQQARANGST